MNFLEEFNGNPPVKIACSVGGEVKEIWHINIRFSIEKGRNLELVFSPDALWENMKFTVPFSKSSRSGDVGKSNRRTAMDPMFSLCSFVKSDDEVTFALTPILGRVNSESLKGIPKHFGEISLNSSGEVLRAILGNGEIQIVRGGAACDRCHGATGDLVQGVPEIVKTCSDQIPEFSWNGREYDLDDLLSGIFLYSLGDHLAGIAVIPSLFEGIDVTYILQDLSQQKPRTFEGSYDFVV